MDGTIATSICKYNLFMAIFFVLSTNLVNMELAGLRVSGNFPIPENHASERTTFQDSARSLGRSDHLFAARQSSNVGNVTLNQLADNLNRMEGNLASLIQSFLALQRSVFNLEQLQELLVLLLEDILKQTGNTDQSGGVVNDRANPAGATTSSVSNESLEMEEDNDDDDGVNSADIDEVGEDTGTTDDRGDTDGGDEKGMDNGGGEVKGKGKGGDEDQDQGADPFGALKNLNLNPASTIPHHQPPTRQGYPEENDQRPSADDDDKHDFPQSRESADHSSEMVGSNSVESKRVFQNTNNDVQPKPTSSFTREFAAVPRKPHLTEPLITLAAQLEARLYDMMQRLGHFHGTHNSLDGRMASMRERSSSIPAAGESPMAPPPPFEPLEIDAVAANDALPRKRPVDATPVKVKLQLQQMSPIISHGGPLVGPEDFSSRFMDNLSGSAKISGESLNERSTGMINNMVHLDQTGTASSTNTRMSQSSPPSQPETLPSATDRKRRQAKAGQAVQTETVYVTNTTFPEDSANIHITFGNHNQTANQRTQMNDSKYTIETSTNPKNKTIMLSNGTMTMTNTPPSENFDAHIANLLHDLRQHLNQQYLRDKKHDTSVSKDIDRTVLELNNLIWITPNVSVIQSSKYLNDESNRPWKTPATATTIPPTKAKVSLSPKLKDRKIKNGNKTKLSKNERKYTTNIRNSKLVVEVKDTYALAGANMEESTKDFKILVTTVPEHKLHSDSNTVSVPNIKSATPASKMQNGSVENDVNNATSTHTRWDWLRQLPLVNEEKNINVEWLIETLSNLSQMTSMSDELKSLNARGRQLVKDRNKERGQSHSNEIVSSQEEMDSSRRSISSKESGDASLTSTEEGQEKLTNKLYMPKVRHNYEMTTVKDTKEHESQVDGKANTNMQHPNLMKLDEKLIDDNVNDDNDNQNIGTSNEEGSEETDKNDTSNETKEQEGEEDELNGTNGSYEQDMTVEESEESDDTDSSDNETIEQDNNEDENQDITEDKYADEESKDIDTAHKDKDGTITDDKNVINKQKTFKGDQRLSDDKGSSIKVDMTSKQPTLKDLNNDYNTVESSEVRSTDDRDNQESSEVKSTDTDRDNQESSEVRSTDTDRDNQEDSRVVSNEMRSSEEKIKDTYFAKDLTNEETQALEPPSEFDDIVAYIYNNQLLSQQASDNHKIRKRHTQHHRQRGSPYFIRKSKSLSHGNVQSHRLQKRQVVPSFWQFLYGNTAHSANPPAQTFGPQTALGQNHNNPFSFQSGFQDWAGVRSQFGPSSFTNPHFGQSLPNNPQLGQSSLHNTQFRQSPLDNSQLGQSSLHNTQFGQSPLDNSQLGQSSLHSTQFGQSPLDNSQLGQSSLHNSQLGQPLSHNSQNRQPPQQTPHKSHFPSFASSSLPRNFPFPPPIGGYPQYYGYRGFQHPQFGYPGDPSGSNYEPGESPAAEAAADMEEIMTSLFQRYWENVQNLFTPIGPPTTPEYEYEGPIPTAAATTTAVPTKTVTATTITSTSQMTTPQNTTTATRTTAPTPTAAPPNATTTVSSSNSTVNTTQKINQTTEFNFNATGVNSTVTITSQSQNISSVSNITSTVSSTGTPSPPQINPVTVPNPQPDRGNPIFFRLIKSLEMVTRKPTV